MSLLLTYSALLSPSTWPVHPEIVELVFCYDSVSGTACTADHNFRAPGRNRDGHEHLNFLPEMALKGLLNVKSNGQQRLLPTLKHPVFVLDCTEVLPQEIGYA